MFKIECLVDDKKLSSVMHALADKCYELKVVPVTNATATPNGKVHANNSGSVVKFVADYIKKHRLKDFQTNLIADVVTNAGWQKRNAANYALNSLREQGVLRLVRKGVASNPSKWRVV